MTRGRSLGRACWWALATLPLGFIAIFLVWPATTVLFRAFGAGEPDGTSLTVDAWAEATVTTLGLAAAGTFGSVVIGVPLAWATHHLSWPGVATVRAVVGAPFVLPTVVVALAFASVFGKGGFLAWTGIERTPLVIVLALVFYNASVVARVVGAAWSRSDPRRQAAARTLGASRLAAFRLITLVELGPAVASAALLAFVFCASSFAVVLVLGDGHYSTLETEVYFQVNRFLNLRAASVIALTQLAVVGAALVLSERLGERATGSSSSTTGPRREPSGIDIVLVTAVLAVYFLLLAVPLGNLVYRSFRIGQDWTLQNYRALADTSVLGLGSESIASAAARSLSIALAASTIAMILGVIVATLAHRPARRGTLLANASQLPLAVSSVFLGVGLLLTMHVDWLGLDLRASPILLVSAQALIALPFVVRTLRPALAMISSSLRAAAASLGASPLAVLRTIDLPLIAPALGVAWSFAMAIALGEFAAAALLSRPDQPTLPAAIYRLFGRPGAESLGTAYAATVLLAIVTAAIMLLPEARLSRRSTV